jgi:hypothetical protein
MVNRFNKFEQMLMFSYVFFIFLENKRVTVGLLHTKRSVLKRGIQQCKIQWNKIVNKGAKVNRVRTFEQIHILVF